MAGDVVGGLAVLQVDRNRKLGLRKNLKVDGVRDGKGLIRNHD